MSSYCDNLRARINENRRRLRSIAPVHLIPIGNSVDAPSMVIRSLYQRIARDEKLLAEHISSTNGI